MTVRLSRVRIFLALALIAAELAIIVAPIDSVSAQTALRDYPIPGGWFYSQESRAPQDAPPFRGYTVIDDGEAAFWTEYRRYGMQNVLGYPVSQRYRYPDEFGYLHQAFQRGILQWRPEEGRAVLANVFEQFTEQGLDDALETVGIPRARPGSDLPFEEDAARRMTWITEPRFLARYFLNPITRESFDNIYAAWDWFGLPQGFPERPVYLRERLNGKFGPPLYQPYIAQRFQKASLQLFLEDQLVDPTIVPGDGRAGCVAITASGRLARRLGAGAIIPGLATFAEPVEDPPRITFVAFIPPAATPEQTSITFELIGTGYNPGEPITIRLTPLAPADTTTPTGPILSTVVTRVDAADADGSFDQLVTARIGVYTLQVTGELSGKVLDPSLDPTVDLTQPTSDVVGQTTITECF